MGQTYANVRRYAFAKAGRRQASCCICGATCSTRFKSRALRIHARYHHNAGEIPFGEWRPDPVKDVLLSLHGEVIEVTYWGTQNTGPR
jgi:hypothetical protein